MSGRSFSTGSSRSVSTHLRSNLFSASSPAISVGRSPTSGRWRPILICSSTRVRFSRTRPRSSAESAARTTPGYSIICATSSPNLAQTRNLSLHIRPSAALVHSDPQLLEQMIRNLPGNAARYQPAHRRKSSCGDHHRQKTIWPAGPRPRPARRTPGRRNGRFNARRNAPCRSAPRCAAWRRRPRPCRRTRYCHNHRPGSVPRRGC
ncbi:hypothetical protein BH10PSE15_BH10PSE15_13160 [soil metagenome]